MIAGRPTNLWLGLTTAISGAVAASAIVLGADPTIVGTLAGVWSGVLGAAILLIANQPPVLSPGDTFTKVTPTGEPNKTVTV
jgi:membrane associated rhomboid family serine protease